MDAVILHRGSGVRCGNSLLFSRNSFRTRCGISFVLLAGSSVAMEARDFLSALGGAGAVWLWRAAVHFLSAGVMDSGSGAERHLSLDCGGQNLHLARTHRGGRIYVFAGEAMA